MFKPLSSFLVLFLFCHLLVSQTIISGGSENDIIGRICRLPNSSLATIVERNPDWGSGDLYISFSADDGTSWSDLSPVVVKSGNQSTHCIVVTPDDSLRVYYASNETGTYKIRTISSADGITWVNDFQLDLGWPQSQGVYDPHVIVEDDGSMTMTYVKFGGGGYVAHCTEINEWDLNKSIIQSGAFRIRICKQSSGKYLAAYHRNIGGNQYEAHVRFSYDLIIWSDVTLLTGSGNTHDPTCNTVNDEFWVFYSTYKNGAYNLFKRSSSDGLYWSEEEQFTNDNTNNTQSAFFAEADNVYLIWTHAINYNTDNDIYFEKYEITGFSEYNELEDNFDVIRISNQNFLLMLPSGLSGPAELSVYNMQGQLVQRKLLYAGTGNYRFDIELDISGVYLFCIDIDEKAFNSKVVVK